jgi:hypothetical protein
MSGDYHLTFDVDWAPDWSVRETLDVLSAADVRATFFVTHVSPTVEEVAAAGHEVGIHPNFQVGSTQGVDPIGVVGRLLEIVPDARVMRTHGLVQGSLLLRDVLKAFPQITYDMSILTYRFPHTAWFGWKLQDSQMRRINYTWEDDVAFYDDEQNWVLHAPSSEVDILDFHPIHVSLNSADERNYERAKQVLGPRPLTELGRNEAWALRGSECGTADYLHAVLASPGRAISFEELLCV